MTTSSAGGGSVAPHDEVMRATNAELLSRLEGTEPKVLGEVVSDLIALDVLFYPPTEDSPCWTVVTSGMSDLPMTVPPDYAHLAYAELTLALPETFEPGDNVFADEANYWPIGLIKRLARYPHEAGTYLTVAQTVAFADPPVPLDPDGQFVAVLIGIPMLLGDEATEAVPAKDGRLLNLLSVIPLRAEEYELARTEGADALFDAISTLASRDPDNELTEYVDPNRPSLVADAG